MGFLHYGGDSAAKFDDRPLAHLERALMTLLREGRGVAFTFEQGSARGSVRETVWIGPTSEVRFRFLGNRAPSINERWVEAIILTADESSGLRLVPEPSQSPSVYVYRAGHGGPSFAPRPM